MGWQGQMTFKGRGIFGGVGHAVVAAVLACGLLAGCASEVRTHGYVPVDEELAQVQPGRDTRGSVRRKIGRPGGTGIFTDKGWYYVSSEIEHFMYTEPEVVDRKVVEILFDNSDRVVAVNRYGLEDGRIVPLETNITETYGRELTIVEQAFGNIGIATEEIFGGEN